MHHHSHVVLWAVFALTGLFAIFYKAVMSSKSDVTNFHTVAAYFTFKVIVETIMRFLIAQIGYFFIIDNPHLVGDLFTGVEGATNLTVAPHVLAAALGLASDKVADVIITIGKWLYNRIEKMFGGNDKADGAAV